MGKKKLKQYIQIIQNKVSIAVAIAVIKSKPAYLTAEQYAEKLQTQAFDHWVKDINSSLFENKIIELQRDNIFKEINGLLLLPKQENNQAISILNETIPNVCSEEYLSDEFFIESDTDSSSNETVKNNLSFIHAMVQLKFTVESNKSLNTADVQHYINKLSQNEQLSEGKFQKLVSYSEDSGFGDVHSQRCTDAISSGTFRFVTHSSKTDHLIKKCMASVIQFAYKSVSNETMETYNLWKGSVIEYLCSVLQEISFNPVCSDYILKFIIKILDKLWNSQEVNKHTIWGYQQAMLIEFCVNSHLCESVINAIIEKVNMMTDVVQTIQFGTPEHLNSTHLFEKIPHLMHFLTGVMKKFHFYIMADFKNVVKDIKNNAHNEVKDLWKLKWGEQQETKTDCMKKYLECLLQKWKEACEKLITASADNFPLVAIYTWEAVTSFQSLNTEISS